MLKTNVAISPAVYAVLEPIAAKVHEQWCKGRIAEGWRYGLTRNDALKETPCLVDYGELPESEKEYDRNTALCVIKTLLNFGFSIDKGEI